MQSDVLRYLEEREMWRAQERLRAEEELRKIMDYNIAQQQRHDAIKAQKKSRDEAQEQVLKKITAEIAAKQREEEELRQLLTELYQEEAEQKSLQRQRAEAEKREKNRVEMVAANENQKAMKRKMLEEHAKEEAKMRAEMIAQFEMDERLAQMNEIRRKREVANYKQEVERLLAEKRCNLLCGMWIKSVIVRTLVIVRKKYQDELDVQLEEQASVVIVLSKFRL